MKANERSSKEYNFILFFFFKLLFAPEPFLSSHLTLRHILSILFSLPFVGCRLNVKDIVANDIETIQGTLIHLLALCIEHVMQKVLIMFGFVFEPSNSLFSLLLSCVTLVSPDEIYEFFHLLHSLDWKQRKKLIKNSTL